VVSNSVVVSGLVMVNRYFRSVARLCPLSTPRAAPKHSEQPSKFGYVPRPAIRADCRSGCFSEAWILFRKPVPTFRDHANAALRTAIASR
jgi:hypothetical protein